jgi:phage terminase small subunit
MAAKLKPKHRKVVDSYLKCFNKTQAMLDAGYSESMAKTRHQDVFGREDVQSEIERRQKLAAHRSDITLDWIVERLKDIADANIGDMLDIYSDGSASINFEKMTPAIARSLKKFSSTVHKGKVNNTVELSDQLRALELLIRHLGLSKEKQSVELSGEVSLVEQLHAGRSRAGLDGGED